jgi:hypothetical protein
MEHNEDGSPAAPPTETSLRLQITDLLLNRLRDVRTGRSVGGQRKVLKEIETALETYGSYFYPPEHR